MKLTLLDLAAAKAFIEAVRPVVMNTVADHRFIIRKADREVAK